MHQKMIPLIFLPLFLLLYCSAEKILIEEAREAKTIKKYEDYLSKYKNGEYVNEAKQKIEEIKKIIKPGFRKKVRRWSRKIFAGTVKGHNAPLKSAFGENSH